MENCTGNSNCTGHSNYTGVGRGDFGAFGILMPAIGGLLFVLSVPTIIALCTTRTIAKGLRIYLISALVSGIMINTSSVLAGLIALVTVYSGAPAPPPLFCRFMLWVYNNGALARSFSVVGYSVMVLIVVRYGKKNLKAVYIILSLCFVWGVTLILTIEFQVPQVYAVDFIVGAVCLPIQDATVGNLFFTVFLIAIVTFIPLVVCSAVPLIVLRYIKKHTITRDADSGKAVVKLGLFLLTGILVNSASSTVSSTLVYFSTGGIELVYWAYAVGVLSLYPTPILIIIFLKPVRDKMKTFLLCKHLIGRPLAAKITDNS